MERGLCANTILFTLLILILLQHGVSSNAGNDQAMRLKALRDAKMMNRGDQIDQGEFEWNEKLLMNINMDDYDDEVGNMEDDHIKGGLPGQPSNVEFSQFSGYVTVDKRHGRSLFYYFVEAVQGSSSKPLVLWLNGGPGCSSLGMGAMIEIGPFGVRPDGETLYRRHISWNIAANVLFLESPAGVGFSYSNNTRDYNTTGDRSTAIDTYTFLINWFKIFPQYKTRDLFITGESYAGFYIPELADLIMVKKNVINLKGIMIGNGIMNFETDAKGMYEYKWTHALISDETYEGTKKNCFPMNDKCKDFESQIWGEVGDIDMYNIYGPNCISGTSKPSRRFHRKFQAYDPCEINYVHNYLNLPHVQEAIHANITKLLPYEWDLCSDVIKKWADSPTTMFPIYKRLISSGLHIHLYSGDTDAVVPVTSTRYSINAMFPIYKRLISSGLHIHLYSGDTDAVVPVTSTRYSINALNLTIIKPWHYWVDHDMEVGGYRVSYEGLTFTTVRGAGHEVPKYASGRALALLSYLLSQK